MTMDSEKHSPKRQGFPACDECRIRKVRCSREGSKCSHCLRYNLSCEFSSKVTRVNQTAKLARDVENLGNRLGNIEHALQRCLSYIEDHQGSKNHLDPESEESRRTSPANPEESAVNCHSGQHTLTTEEDECSPLHSHCSFVSLVMEAQAASIGLASWILTLRMSSHQTTEMAAFHHQAVLAVRTKWTEANETFQEIIEDVPTLLASEGNGFLPSLPPRALVEKSINVYFKELNPRLPIFSQQTIENVVESQYTMSIGSADPVCITALNCMVLQALTQTSVAEKEVWNIVIDEVVMGLRGNIRQCYNRLETLLQPRLLNVQALFSLALVAMEYFNFAMFQAIFAQVCELSRLIGLHSPTTEDEAVRRDLFWSIFLVDKHVSIIGGKACLLPSYDCNVPLPLYDSTAPLSEAFAARIRLSFILEEIYQDLYSAKSKTMGRSRVRHQIGRIGRKLSQWTVRYEHVLRSGVPSRPFEKYICATQLRFSLSSCWVLLHRRIGRQERDPVCMQHARACLMLFKQLCDACKSDTIAGFSNFDSVVMNYSLISFIEIYVYIVENNQQDHSQDTEILAFFTMHANRLAYNTTSASISYNVSQVANHCNDIVLLLQNLRKTHFIPSSIPRSPTTQCIDYNTANTSTSTSSTGSSYNLNIDPPSAARDSQAWNIYFDPRDIQINSANATLDYATQYMLSTSASGCLELQDFFTWDQHD